MLRRGAVAFGGMAGLGLLDPGSVFGSVFDGGAPSDSGRVFTCGQDFVPSGADLHFLLPGIGFEMSTITDFKGVVGGSETRGTAHAGANGNQYSFDGDMRFMRGLYVGLDGRMHNGSFGFI